MDAGKTIQDGISMVQKLSDTVIDYLVKYGFQVLGGILIILVGMWAANRVADFSLNFFKKKRLDVTLAKFLAMTVKSMILVFVFLMAIEKFGVTISPLIATVSAMIFGASFAIQAPLSNCAAGLSVILTHPFVVGNTISVKGVHGVVEEVKLPCTILVNGDGERITIPNKDVVGEILFNSGENKVVERMIGISYSDDPAKAIGVILDSLKRFSKVTQSPPPQIGIDGFGDSSINIGMRYWVPTKEYYQTLHQANLGIYQALVRAGITIPFPQREVRLLSNEAVLSKGGNTL